MTSRSLSLVRFRALATTYGAAISRWPEKERAAAQALLQESSAARALLAEEGALDTLFEALPLEPLPAGLGARLGRIPTTNPPEQPLRLPRRALWGPAIGWAAAAAVGIWLGARAAEQEATRAETETNPAETAEQAAGSDEEELLELARGSIAGFEELP